MSRRLNFVDLPPNWLGHPDECCSTFQAQPPVGVLQISAARKGRDQITDEDSRDFAADRLDAGIQLQECRFGPFSGYAGTNQKDGLHWREWWLRSGDLMVYVTYNVRQEDGTAEEIAVSSILSSLTVAG